MKTRFSEWTMPGLHANLTQNLPHMSLDSSILDVGCGTGAWLENLSNLGFTALQGIDLDADKFQSTKAVFHQANLDHDDLNLGNSTFDLISSIISSIKVVEHLENPARLFFHAQKYLSPTGYFLMTTPNIHSFDRL